MKVEVIMPKMGESINEGTVIKWHKKVGDVVKKDEIIYEIATDKVDTEIPSPSDGILSEIIVQEQETVPVDTVVAIIESGGVATVKPTKKAVAPKVEPKVETPVVTKIAEKVQEKPKIEKAEGNRFYSPLVLKIASKEGVSFSELEKIEGTGVNGRVTKNDILKYIEQSWKDIETKKPDKNVQSSFSPPQSFGSDETEIIPMDNIRQRIMQHMIHSRDTSVHVTAVNEVDMSKIHNYIRTHKDDLLKKERIKLTYMSFISYACVKALKEFPLMNSSVENKNIIMKKFMNLGIAVAVEPNGLIVPNIKHAENLSVVGFAKAIAELSDKARNKGLTPDDIMNGTFSITNYGVFGLQFGTPIINQPEVGILGVGAVVKKPVVVEMNGIDSIAIKPMMYLSISHDHRLVDGMLGGMFLKSVKDNLENFDTKSV